MVVGIMSANLPDCVVLGSGTMGAQIALSLALGGAKVSLWGRRPETLAPAVERCAEGLDFLAGNGLVDNSDRQNILSRIQEEPDLQQAVRDKGFVIEAVAEDIEVKQQILVRAERDCPADAVLSSTTSALSASAIQSALSNPEQFCIAHYAQPAHLVKLVEVVPGEKSAGSAIEFVTDLLSTTGKIPVLCPDIPGFLWGAHTARGSSGIFKSCW